MELLLRRHLWVVDLIAIAIVATLAGHATATRIASMLLGPPWRSPPRQRPTAQAHGTGPDKSIAGIIERDLFCPTCGDEAPPERSARSLELLAIMFAPPPLDPRWSVAVVRDDEAGSTGPYATGDSLGDATVGAIENVRVVLDLANGRREYLELLAERPPGPSTARVSPGRALADGVRKTGPHSYEVRRAFIDHLGGMTPPWPRFVPEIRDGQPVGFRLYGIRAGSPPVWLGLAEGDLLLQANGRSLATPDAALAAFTTLRTADHVGLLLERDRDQIRLDYLIR
jgi:general secretion pathway protein C